MGIDIEATAYLGWYISTDDWGEICEWRKAVTKSEPRFDTKTGQPIDPVDVVVENEGRYFRDKHMPYRECVDLVQEMLDGAGCADLKFVSDMDDNCLHNGYVIGVDIDNEMLESVFMSAKQKMIAKRWFRTEGEPTVLAAVWVG